MRAWTSWQCPLSWFVMVFSLLRDSTGFRAALCVGRETDLIFVGMPNSPSISEAFRITLSSAGFYNKAIPCRPE